MGTKKSELKFRLARAQKDRDYIESLADRQAIEFVTTCQELERARVMCAELTILNKKLKEALTEIAYHADSLYSDWVTITLLKKIADTALLLVADKDEP